MLKKLAEVEEALPLLLPYGEDWNTLLIDYEHPHVHRLSWQYDKEHRVLLHKIHPCDEGAALIHPHPWPSAMRIYLGAGCSGYEMVVGRGSPDEETPSIPAKLVLQHGSTYEMLHEQSWHSVRPIDGSIYSVMVIGRPFATPKQERFGQGRVHNILDAAQQGDLLDFFRARYI